MSKFWNTWLIIWCWVTAIFALLLIGYAFGPTDAPIQAFVDLIHPVEFDTADPFRFALGVTGAVTLLIAYLYHITIKIENQHKLGPAYWCSLLIPLALWYPTDGAVSIATGFGLNVIPNTLLLLGILIPFVASGVMKEN